MDLYYLPASAPCRAVQMTAAALGIELNLIHTSLDKNEHMTPAFLKLNPEHTVPTLVDNSFSLWESRAIIIYLVDKYAKNDALYPKDPKTRAVINQRLFFDMDTIYESFADYYYPQIFESKPADPEKFKAMEEAIGFLEIFLTGNEYVAGNTMSIADFSLLASISTFDVAKFDLSSYKNVSRWYELCKKTVPGWEINWEGIQQMSTYFDKLSQ